MIEFDNQIHKTSAFVQDDGKIFYYDPNFPFKTVPFDSMDELANLISKTLYNSAEAMRINLFTYKFEQLKKENL